MLLAYAKDHSREAMAALGVSLCKKNSQIFKIVSATDHWLMQISILFVNKFITSPRTCLTKQLTLESNLFPHCVYENIWRQQRQPEFSPRLNFSSKAHASWISSWIPMENHQTAHLLLFYLPLYLQWLTFRLILREMLHMTQWVSQMLSKYELIKLTLAPCNK